MIKGIEIVLMKNIKIIWYIFSAFYWLNRFLKFMCLRGGMNNRHNSSKYLGFESKKRSRITAHFHFSWGKKSLTKWLAYRRSRTNYVDYLTIAWFIKMSEIFINWKVQVALRNSQKVVDCYLVNLIIRGG